MTIYQSKEECVKLAKRIAEESVILLKNEQHCLPLNENAKIALFGRLQNMPVIGGEGSGFSKVDNPETLRDELKKLYSLDSKIDDFYQVIYQKECEIKKEEKPIDLEGLVASGAVYELFGIYHKPIDETLPDESLIKESSMINEVAIYVVGRNAGSEECDRRIEDDYLLSANETKLVSLLCTYFKKVIVVCNSVGIIDLSWTKHEKIQSVLYLAPAGEGCAHALVSVISGKVNPSGKLPYTLTYRYEDYPSAKDFSYNRETFDQLLTYESYGLPYEKTIYKYNPVTVYTEDIYNGYRYFDTFNKPVLYPFGYGLSYTTFKYECDSYAYMNGQFVCNVTIKNTGNFPGKEVIQLYVGAPSIKNESPKKELKAFAKTNCLNPNEEETIELSFELLELAHFNEKEMCYEIEKGNYTIYLGTDINAKPLLALSTKEDILCRKISADIGLKEEYKDKIQLLHRIDVVNEACDEIFEFTKEDINISYPTGVKYDCLKPAVTSKLQDVLEHKVDVESFVNQMTIKEMAVLCCGFGPGLPFGGAGHKEKLEVTIQENGEDIGYSSHPYADLGYQSPAIDKYGIYSIACTDGPAYVGRTAWPTGTALSSTFNMELLNEFGKACGYEVTIKEKDSWLAPGLNIIRNPLCGRNFEYFSEDPYLTGLCGLSITKGAMDNNPITMCLKHFALNEQETYRRGSEVRNINAVDSIISGRAAREIYLKPFEMIVTKSNVRDIMTSFNKINGTFAAGNHVLCTEILREEWGYTGTVVTDWGDIDVVVDGADALMAGNDVVMPGGPPVIRQILKGLEEGRITEEALKIATIHQVNFIKECYSYRKKAGLL